MAERQEYYLSFDIGGTKCAVTLGAFHGTGTSDMAGSYEGFFSSSVCKILPVGLGELVGDYSALARFA